MIFQTDCCINHSRTRLNLFYLKTLILPRRKHSTIQTSQLMLYGDIIVVCSQIHTKHINTLCGQSAELLNVKLAVDTVTTGLSKSN